MNAGNVIALLSLIVAVVVLVMNSRKDVRGDAKQEARTEAKLDGISSGVTEIRVDLRSMREELRDHGQRIAAVEGSAKSAHHRLDDLEKLVHTIHPPATRQMGQ
ncbi:MAG: hypothetical protein J6K55_12330 [Clostridia bacterium]|nr:hypothetical protein [Clostridia bacterium]